MQESQKHLVEVNCGFQFPDETMQWDITYFGQFYEKIKSEGFSEREDRKGFQIVFGPFNEAQKRMPISESQAEDQVLFRNPSRGLVILIGKGKISFHCIKDYPGWERFLNEFIVPFYKIYRSLGLGNGTRQCSIVYLNRYTKERKADLSQYFNVISHIDSKFGQEVNTVVQRIVSNSHNLLITKLNAQVIEPDQLVVNLECGAVCVSAECMQSEDWVHQANHTHAPIFDFYQAVLTEKQKAEL